MRHQRYWFVSRFCLLFIPLAVTVVITLLPILWALVTSLKFEKDVMSAIIHYLPSPATLENYARVWSVNKFFVYFRNSLFISLLSVIFITFLAICNGYALSRFKFKGKKLFMLFLLGTQLIPIVILIIPLFLVFKTVRLINNPLGIILFYIMIQTPFCTLLMKGFIDGVPRQIDEAALVEGASWRQVIFGLITPVILPGIVAVTAFAFIGCWNEFLVAFSFITSSRLFTIPIGLQFMIGEFSVEYASLAAGSVISLIPPLLIFAYVQKYLVAGLSSGSVKG